MDKIVKESLIKNIIVIVILVLLYFPIQEFLLSSNLVTNKDSAGDVLVAVSIIALIACFGNFAFQYGELNLKESSKKYFIHIHTGLMMLIIGISIIFTRILLVLILGTFIITDITLILLYVVCIGFDVLDVLRVRV